MLRIYRAELRDSWPAWLSVSLTFIMVNAALALTIIVGFTGLAAMAAGRLSFENSAAWTIGQALVLLAIVLVARGRLGHLARGRLAAWRARPAGARRGHTGAGAWRDLGSTGRGVAAVRADG